VEAIKAAFDAWAAAVGSRGIVAQWREVERRVDAALAEYGARADWIVLKRPWLREKEPDRQAIHAALFDSGRPVLVVPADWVPTPLACRAAIAWRDDPRTTKAVLAALRALGAADRVDVIVGVRDGAPAR
jgi:hypothetical protein